MIDGEAIWSSDKLATCEIWARREYPWLYALADANGCFELTNLRVIWGKVAAIRPDLTIQRLQEVFEQFTRHGLLFTWSKNGKRYGHWTKSEGRLPPRSERVRHKSLTPDLPVGELAKYLNSFGTNEVSNIVDPGRDLDLVLDRDMDKEKPKTNTAPAALPEVVPIHLWLNFLEMRQKLRRPLTTYGGELIRRKLRAFKEAGEDPVEILEQSIANSWAGVFSLKEKRNGESFNERSSRKSAEAISQVRSSAERILREVESDLPDLRGKRLPDGGIC